MDFWRIIVNPGESFRYNPADYSYFRITQVVLEQSDIDKRRSKGKKKDKPVYIYMKIKGDKRYIGCLSPATCTKMDIHLYCHVEAEFCHSSKVIRVHFYGLHAGLPYQPGEFEYSDFDDSEEEEEILHEDEDEPLHEDGHWTYTRHINAIVRPGKHFKWKPSENTIFHLSQALLGPTGGDDPVHIYVKADGFEKAILGTLSASKCLQIEFDYELYFDKIFKLSHDSKTDNVYFVGNVLTQPRRYKNDTRWEPWRHMRYWSVVVGPGQTYRVTIKGNLAIELTHASLEKSDGKEDLGDEDVLVYVQSGGEYKSIIGTLSASKCTQMHLNLAFSRDIQLCHSSKNARVCFLGHETVSQDKFVLMEEQGEIGALNDEEENSAAIKARNDVAAIVDEPVAEDENEYDGDEDDQDDSDNDEDATGKQPAESASKTDVLEERTKVFTPAGGQKSGGDGSSDKLKEQTPGSIISHRSCPGKDVWNGSFFWSAEVNPGMFINYTPEADMLVYLSHASLGKSKDDGDVHIYVEVDGDKSHLGVLSPGKCTQIPLNLALDTSFRLFHSNSSCVYFIGYEHYQPDEYECDDYSENEVDEDDVPKAPNANGGDGRSDESKERTPKFIGSVSLKSRIRLSIPETVLQAEKKVKRDSLAICRLGF